MNKEDKTREELFEEFKSFAILVSGFAHDFNNLLTAIICNISTARLCANRKSEIFKILGEAEKAALEAKDLTQQLLAFAKGRAPIMKSVSLSGSIEDSARLAATQYGEQTKTDEEMIDGGKRPSDRKPRILVMDDEEKVRSGTQRILKYLGYEVESANDGAAAIALYKRAKAAGQPFDLIIMDLIIPGGLGGKETIQQLLKIDPEAKVIASSGYFNDPAMVNFREYGFSDIIAKPYKIHDLNKIISKVLSCGGE